MQQDGETARTRLIAVAVERLILSVLERDSVLAVTERVVGFAKDVDRRGDALDVLHAAVADVASDEEWQRYCRAIGWSGQDRADVSSDGVLRRAWQQIAEEREAGTP